MAKTKFLIRLISAYFKHFRWIFFLGIIFGFLLFFVIKFILPSINQGGTRKIGMVGRFTTNDLPEDILLLIGDGLTKMSDDGIPQPNLASSWETPDKGKTWIFRIKNDVYWHDNTKLISDNIIYDYTDVEIEKPDNKTLVFKLNEPFSPFPSVVSSPTFQKGLLGTSFWRVDNINLFGGYIQEITLISKSKDRLIYRFYPTLDATKLAFKLGKVDQIVNIIDPDPFNSWNTSMVQESVARQQVVVIFFNTQDKHLSEKSLRQALIYSIDKNILGERALSPINPNSFAYNPQVKPYDYNIDRAKELFSEFPEEIKKEIDIKLITTPVLFKTAEKVVQDWQKVGIKSNVLVSSIIPSEYQAYLTILEIPKDVDQYPLWHSTQSDTNMSKFSNFRIDKLLEEGRVELDTDERRKIYLDFQRFLLEEAPAAFLYHPRYYSITRK
ncbi:MAG: Extracellular solute-binding protein [Microgenomates group bacterium GW2011_GWC1_37_8]|nr:MAG: Extracellular solute-binding protein [Microgenomates group bacterium GW2011_GWC1_37_8]